MFQMEGLVSSSFCVEVQYDKDTRTFSLSGPVGQVNAAIDSIHNNLHQLANQESKLKEAKDLYAKTVWHWIYKDTACVGYQLKAYSELPNFTIERAYCDGKDRLELVTTAGKQYCVDLRTLVEYPATNKGDKVHLIRKELIKGVFAFLF